MKALLTFLVVPLGLWFNIHAFMDITLTGHWDLFGETTVHVRYSGAYCVVLAALSQPGHVDAMLFLLAVHCLGAVAVPIPSRLLIHHHFVLDG